MDRPACKQGNEFSGTFSQGMVMAISIFLFGFFPALLLAAAVYDLCTYTIPNLLPVTLLGLFVIYMIVLFAAGDPLPLRSLAMHAGAAALALSAGVALFAKGWIGGGDAKFFAAVCLWVGFGTMAEYTMAASLAGGALTVLLLLIRRLPVGAFIKARWVLRLADPEAGVPYGVALAIGAVMVLPYTDLFRLSGAH